MSEKEEASSSGMKMLLTPQPGDFRIVPVPGVTGLGISVGQFLNGERFARHDHAEVYLGNPPSLEAAEFGWTASAYPNRIGLRKLDVAPGSEADSGSVWSTGRIELMFEQRQGIVEWCLEHPDTPYGWLDYAALTLHRLGMNDPGLRRRIAAEGSRICSQYVDAAWNLGGDVHLFTDGRWEGYVTPEALAALVI
jgi:hypothetical protein